MTEARTTVPVIFHIGPWKGQRSFVGCLSLAICSSTNIHGHYTYLHMYIARLWELGHSFDWPMPWEKPKKCPTTLSSRSSLSSVGSCNLVYMNDLRIHILKNKDCLYYNCSSHKAWAILILRDFTERVGASHCLVSASASADVKAPQTVLVFSWRL